MSRSPNHGPRRDGLRPELVVLHYTAMADCEAAARVLCDPRREVSAHYLISRQGEIISLVAEEHRAWHAGRGSWGAQDDVNSRSIGIELDNDGASPFAAPLMDALEGLLPEIMQRWSIAAEGVIAHSDMAPTRKSDPGPRFDWRRLARGGLAIWPDISATSATDPSGLRDDLIAFGYPALDEDILIAAMRLRFRPHKRGAPDATDAAIARALATRQWR